MKTGSDTTTYTYDGQDQLIKVQVSGLPGSVSTYTFDGDGMRRTAQEGNVQPTTMVWDGSDYLFLDGPSSDQLVLTLDGEIVASDSKDLLTDPLGMLVREITAGATLSGQFDLYPYGRLVAGSPTPATPFVFVASAGYFRDNADRDYIRARELHKLIGRWMQTDPIWGMNLPPSRIHRRRRKSLMVRALEYAKSSPIALADPTGLRPATHDVGEASCDFYFPDCQAMCHAEYVEEIEECLKKGSPIRTIFCLWKNYRDFLDCLLCCDMHTFQYGFEENNAAVCYCINREDREEALDGMGWQDEPAGVCVEVIVL